MEHKSNREVDMELFDGIEVLLHELDVVVLRAKMAKSLGIDLSDNYDEMIACINQLDSKFEMIEDKEIRFVAEENIIRMLKKVAKFIESD